jgi:Zn-dependent protease
MRDPLNWSIPLFRVFGIQVRLHILYIVVVLGMMLRQIRIDREHWLDYLVMFVLILFIIILLHEFGHCFAARREGGDADKILMWPLGGLAFCDVPHSPRAHFNTAFGGPLVNILICLACAAVIIPFGYLPPMNPLHGEQAFDPHLRNWHDGTTHVVATLPLSEEPNLVWVKEGTDELIRGRTVRDKDGNPLKEGDKGTLMVDDVPVRATLVTHLGDKSLPALVAWSARIFWLSWFLFLFNVLLPAFPLDGGRMLQAIIWGKTDDYRKGTMVAVYCGIGTSFIFLFLAFFSSDPMFMGLGLFILFACYQQWMALEIQESESVFGYDFSQGYTSLEKDEAPAPKPKKLGFFRRWLEARRQRRAQREADQRASDELRMDELLDKIHRLGKEALSDEEKWFMARVSARYRKKSP